MPDRVLLSFVDFSLETETSGGPVDKFRPHTRLSVAGGCGVGGEPHIPSGIIWVLVVREGDGLHPSLMKFALPGLFWRFGILVYRPGCFCSAYAGVVADRRPILNMPHSAPKRVAVEKSAMSPLLRVI